MAMAGLRRLESRVAAITASASEPTNPAMGGRKCTPPSGFMTALKSRPRSCTGRASAGANGALPNPLAARPSAR